MAGKKVNIDITTTANNAGFSSAKSAIDALTNSTNKQKIAASDLMTAAEAEVAEVNRLTDASKRAAAAQAELAKQATFTGRAMAALGSDATAIKMMDNATASTQRYVYSSRDLVNANTKAGASSNLAGHQVTNLGHQIQDVAVQAQMGTNALTIMAQQGPQIASAFGPKGAAVGAIIALGAVATQVFLKMVSNAKEAGEEAKRLGGELEEAYEKAAGEGAKKAAEGLAAVTSGLAAARLAEIDLTSARNARISADSAALKSQEDLTIAAIEYLAASGQIADKEAAIAAVRKKAAEDQIALAKQESEQKIATEQAKFAVAQQQVDDKKSEAQTIQEEIDQLQKDQEHQLKLLNIRRAGDKAQVGFGREKEGFVSPSTARAEADFKATDALIKELSAQVDSIQSEIPALIDAVYQQGYQIDQAVSEAQTTIQAVESQFGTQEKIAEITATTERMGAAAEAINQEIGKFEPINDVQRQAKESLLAVAADGQITSEDTRQVAGALQVLMGTLKTGQEGNLDMIRRLIETNTQLATATAILDRKVQKLEQLTKNLPIR